MSAGVGMLGTEKLRDIMVSTERFKILARYMEGVKVHGYLVESSLGIHYPFTKELAEYLALERRIVNCTAQKYYADENKARYTINMKGTDCKLTDLPVLDFRTGLIRTDEEVKPKQKDKSDMLEIKAKLIQGKNVMGYRLYDAFGAKHDLPRGKVLILARDGKIVNARAQASKTAPEGLILRSDVCDLAKLPAIKIGAVG